MYSSLFWIAITVDIIILVGRWSRRKMYQHIALHLIVFSKGKSGVKLNFSIVVNDAEVKMKEPSASIKSRPSFSHRYVGGEGGCK